MKVYLLRGLLCVLVCASVGPRAAAPTIEFETTEVPTADVSVSPDEPRQIIFDRSGED